MEIGEQVAIAIATAFLLPHEGCPFENKTEGPPGSQEEDIAWDDRKEAEEHQENDGGVLGKNLAKGSHGREDTIGGPFPAQKVSENPATDTTRTKGLRQVRVLGTDCIATDVYPFHTAAHHLIPGDASLRDSDLANYMRKGRYVTINSGEQCKISHNIGYNVNGAHNGVWLPGHYSIRKKKSKNNPYRATPVKNTSWGQLKESHSQWQMHYVAAVCETTGCQFHDSHTEYNESAKSVLNKIASKLRAHQSSGCEICNKAEIPPPYRIKDRLYALAGYFRHATTTNIHLWRRPWFTSDRWRDIIFDDYGQVDFNFSNACSKARLVELEGPVGRS